MNYWTARVGGAVFLMGLVVWEASIVVCECAMVVSRPALVVCECLFVVSRPALVVCVINAVSINKAIDQFLSMQLELYKSIRILERR